jgi:membrane-bound lytic murein transglycosylase B
MLGAYNLGPAYTYYDFYKLAGLIITGKVERSKAKAFEDGRIGQVQLLPDEWDIWARDGDGDGKVDIWSNRSDIFASLGPIQWERGLPIMVEVERRPFEPTSAAEVRFLRGLKRGNVSVYMFRRPGGGAWPAEARTWSGRYVEPFGPSGPAFILTRNFTPVNYRNPAKPRYWPENEDPGFGVAVGLLADAIAGRPAPSRSTH